jgi:hypothetical protein
VIYLSCHALEAQRHRRKVNGWWVWRDGIYGRFMNDCMTAVVVNGVLIAGYLC